MKRAAWSQPAKRGPLKVWLKMDRKFHCANHDGGFRGKGMTRVFRKIVFYFCPECWRHDRKGCDATMHAIAG